MSLAEGMDPERVRLISVQLDHLAERTSDVQTQGSAMIRILEDAWGGADMEGFLVDWSALEPRLADTSGGLRSAAQQLDREADQQDDASKGSRAGRGWWDRMSDLGHSLLDQLDDAVDTVGDLPDDLGTQQWLGEGIDWVNERWKDFADSGVMETVIGFLRGIGDWFDDLPWWGKAIIGVVLLAAAVAAIVFLGLPALVILGIAATIYGVLEMLNEFADFLEDPAGFLRDWWENSSLFDKVVVLISIILTPFGGRILGPLLRKLDEPVERFFDWVRRKLGLKDPDAPDGTTPKEPGTDGADGPDDTPETTSPKDPEDGRSDGTGDGPDDGRQKVELEDGSTHETAYAKGQIDRAASEIRLQDLLAKHDMTREEFDEALMEPVPSDPADLSPDQRKLMEIRTEMGAPQAGEPMQKVLPPGDADKYIDGTYDSVQGSVTRLDDAASMDTPEELRDGLRLDYDGNPYPEDMQEVQVIRFSSDTDAEVSRFSSMDGKSGTDDWSDPYTGNGFTKSTDPVVPESTLPKGSSIEDGAEIWTVHADGSETLDAVYVEGEGWVRAR